MGRGRMKPPCRCEDCKWWGGYLSESSCYGECHLNPPTVAGRGDCQTLPQTAVSGYCSHFTPRREEEPTDGEGE